MNIVICHNYSSFSYADSSKQLARQLAGEGHRVWFISHHQPDEESDTAGLTLLRWPQRRPTGWASCLFLYRLLKTEQIDCLLAHAAAVGIAALAGSWAGTPRRLAYYHSAYQATVIDNAYPPWRAAWHRWRKRVLYRSFHQIVCVSRFAAADLTRVFGYPAARTAVVPNALADRGLRTPPPPAGPTFVFFCPGRVDPGKNTADMMQGFVAASQHFPPGSFELRLAGSGSQADALAAQCQPLAPLVKWQGALPYAQIDAAFAQCHVAVMATRAEAFGMVAIEAMMHGRLAMVSAVDALPELVQHGRTGWLVKGHGAGHWAAAFQQVFTLLLQQPNLYTQYCQQGRQHYLQHFQQQPQLQRLKQLMGVKGA